MLSFRLERKLVVAVLAVFIVPTVVAGAVLLALYRRGVLEDPRTLGLAVGIGAATMVAYLALVTHALGRFLVRTLQRIQLGAELIATVNPDHRLEVRTGDELQELAAEINRMADRMRDARGILEEEIALATRALAVERSKLSAVLATIGDGVVVAAADGRIVLANPVAQGILGAAAGSLLGRSLFDFVDRDKVVHFLEQLQTSPRTAPRFALRAASGALLDAVMTSFAAGEEEVGGLVLVFRDVTDLASADETRERRLADSLRDVRGPLASIRSLSESLLDDPGPREAAGGMLRAIHAEAVRLSRLVAGLAAPEGPGVPRPPRHFETITVEGLLAAALRRLRQRVDVRSVGAIGLDPGDAAASTLRADTSTMSLALAHLLEAVLSRRAPAGTAWLRARRRGRLVQLEIGGDGQPASDVDVVLDDAVSAGLAGQPSVREIVHHHFGEVWGYAADDRLGFRLTLPVESRRAVAGGPGVARAAVSFVGAGIVSGVDATGEPQARPDLYDFSLIEQMERHLSAVDRDRELADLEYVVLDVETTGLEPASGDRIVSLAGVRIRHGAVKRGEIFDALVNPGRPIPASSVKFHGITDDVVADAPPIEVVLPAFLRFAEGALLVGHQVWFDLRFLERDAERAGRPPLTLAHPVLDTLRLSELVHGPLPAHSLEAVAGRLGVPIRGRHSALGDALATADVFVRLLELLKRRGIVTLGQALDASRRVRGRGPR